MNNFTVEQKKKKKKIQKTKINKKPNKTQKHPPIFQSQIYVVGVSILSHQNYLEICPLEWLCYSRDYFSSQNQSSNHSFASLKVLH